MKIYCEELENQLKQTLDELERAENDNDQEENEDASANVNVRTERDLVDGQFPDEDENMYECTEEMETVEDGLSIYEWFTRKRSLLIDGPDDESMIDENEKFIIDENEIAEFDECFNNACEENTSEKASDGAITSDDKSEVY